ncbi:hypothetical protein BKA65DRAFT_481382 [Rhexocercosporidium sp. MPI-PUGE-AT-0058]|nr:hypothetical protein BKA65DRAFT_481382 [Rhexocercosporidium sp. MPI-PUGE-AT-0058]
MDHYCSPIMEMLAADPANSSGAGSLNRPEDEGRREQDDRRASSLLPHRPPPDILQHESRSSVRVRHLRKKPSAKIEQVLTASVVDPDQYAKSIKAHSSRSITSSSFPGNNYIDLATWLLQDSESFQSLSNQPHLLALLYELGVQGSENSSTFAQSDVQALASVPRPSKDRGQILFIRGYMSPEWITTIGSKYGIDPEFILRHLDFFASSTYRRLFSLPSLASTTNNTTRLCVNTILYRDGSSQNRSSGPDIMCQWREEAEALSTYKRQLRNQARCGDSLIREYSTLDEHYAIVEQWISISLTRNGEGWLGLVWMDQGRDLTLSPGGPWTTHIRSNASAFPIIQHHPKMTSRTTYNSTGVVSCDLNTLRSPYNSSMPPVPQSGYLLPLEYDSLLTLTDLSRRSVTDPLIALAPVLAHAAFSENQVLNLIRGQIDHEVDALVPEFQGSIEKLQYLSNILDRHVTQLKQSVRAIEMLFEAHCSSSGGQLPQRRNRRERGSAESIASHLEDRDSRQDAEGILGSFFGSPSGTFTPKGLVGDYKDLHDRAAVLSGRCTTGIEIMMNKAMVKESKKAVEQTGRLKKLTLLATFFIPLSFSSSIFGMNFKVFGQGELGLWWFFVLSVPITTVAFIYYLWDAQKSRDVWKRVRKCTKQA